MYWCTIVKFVTFKALLRLFSDFFLLQKNKKTKQKCSRVTSNCHIGMRVGSFESTDNEKTFYFYSMVVKDTESFVNNRSHPFLKMSPFGENVKFHRLCCQEWYESILSRVLTAANFYREPHRKEFQNIFMHV